MRIRRLRDPPPGRVYDFWSPVKARELQDESSCQTELGLSFGDRRVRQTYKAKVKTSGHEFDSRYLHQWEYSLMVEQRVYTP